MHDVKDTILKAYDAYDWLRRPLSGSFFWINLMMVWDVIIITALQPYLSLEGTIFSIVQLPGYGFSIVPFLATQLRGKMTPRCFLAPSPAASARANCSEPMGPEYFVTIPSVLSAHSVYAIEAANHSCTASILTSLAAYM